MPRVAVVVAVAALGWLSSPAVAQPKVKPAYTKAYQAGQDALLLGKYDEARKHFERAKKIQPELPGAYRMLADVAEKQGRPEDCLTEAHAYLKRTSNVKRVRETRKLHRKCRVALNRPKFNGAYSGGGAISVTSNVEQATVRLNGLKYGATPLPPRAVAAGKSDICLEAPRYIEKCVEVDILEGIVTDVHIDLDRDPNAPPDPGLIGRKEVEVGWVTFAADTPNTTITMEGKPIATDAQGRVERAPGVYETVATADGHEPWRRRVRVLRGQNRTITIKLRSIEMRAKNRRLGYISLGVAAFAAGGGVLFSMKEHSAREEAQDIYDTEVRRPAPPQRPFCDLVPCRTDPRADMEDAIDRADKWQTGALISFGVAAAALGTSIYFFIQERPSERKGFELPLAVTPIPDGEGGIAGVGALYTTEIDW